MAVFKLLGLDANVYATEYIKNALSSAEQNPIKDAVHREVFTAVENSVNRSLIGKDDTVVIREVLNIEQQNTLINLYPRYKLVFSGEIANKHALAAASRRLEYKECLQLVCYDRDTASNHLGKCDDYVVDIGGDFYKHVNENNQGVHSCCPILDIRDDARFSDRVENLRRGLDRYCSQKIIGNENMKHISRYQQVLEDIANQKSNSWVCWNKAQDCQRKARYAIAIQSCYDIKLRELGDIMSRRGITQCYGTFLYDDRMFVEKSGNISGVNCYYRISKETGKITFSFVGDESLTYQHNIDTYFSYLLTNIFFSSDLSSRFVLELRDRKAGVQYFKVTAVGGAPVHIDRLTHFLWMDSFKGFTAIKYFDVDYDCLAVGDYRKAFVKKTIYVETKTVERLRSHAYASTEAKFKPVELFNYLLSFMGRIFFGSDVCQRNEYLPTEQAIALANAVYIDIFVKKFDAGKITQQILRDVEFDREFAQGGIISKLGMFTRRPKVFKLDHFSDVFLQKFFKPLHALLWVARKRRSLAKELIEDCVSFLECTNSDTYTYSYRYFFCKAPKFFYNGKSFPEVQYDLSVPKFVEENAVLDVNNMIARVVTDSLGGVEPVGLLTVSGEKPERKNGVIAKLGAIGFKPKKSVLINYHQWKNQKDSSFSKVPNYAKIIVQCLQNVNATMAVARKSVRDHVPPQEFQKTKRALTVEPEGKKHGCISRAQFKLQDIMAKFFAGKKFVNAMDLCAGPGGFLKILSERVSGTVYFHAFAGATEASKMRYDLLAKLPGYKRLCRMEITETDLTKEEAVGEILEMLERKNFSVDLLTADGAIHDDSNDDKEGINKTLILAEVTIALRALKKGGCLVLKFFGINEISTSAAVVMLETAFEDVTVYRSPYTPQTSSELYLICKGYHTSKNLHAAARAIDILGAIKKNVEKVEKVLTDMAARFKPVTTTITTTASTVATISTTANTGGVPSTSVAISKTLTSTSSGNFSSAASNVSGTTNASSVSTTTNTALSVVANSGKTVFTPVTSTAVGSIGATTASTNSSIVITGTSLSTANGTAVIPSVSINSTVSKSTTTVTQSIATVSTTLPIAGFTSKSGKFFPVPSVPNTNTGTMKRNNSQPKLGYDDTKPSRTSSTVRLDALGLQVSRRPYLDVDVPADGDCLFYCLAGGDRADVNALKKNLRKNLNMATLDKSIYNAISAELSQGAWGGTAVVGFYSKIFNTNVAIFDCNNDDPLYLTKNQSRHQTSLDLAYSGTHYKIRARCDLPPALGPTRQKVLNGVIDLDELYQDVFDVFMTKGVFAAISRKLPCAALFFGGSSDTIYRTSNCLCSTGEHIFFESSKNFCYQHDECVNNKLHRLLTALRMRGYRKTVITYLDLVNDDLGALQKIIDQLGVKYVLLPIAKYVRKGYMPIAFFFSLVSNGLGVKMTVSTAVAHVKSCVYCVEKDFSSNNSYDDQNNTYYFCSDHKPRVTVSNDFTGADVVFKLTVIGADDDKSGKATVTPDCVLIPCRVKNRNNLSTKAVDIAMTTKALATYLHELGSIQCAALMVDTFQDVKFIIDLLSQYCPRVLVSTNKIAEATKTVSTPTAIFSPVFHRLLTNEDALRNSMIEVKELHRITTEYAKSNLKKLHQFYEKLVQNGGSLSMAKNTKPDYGFIDMRTATYVCYPKTGGKNYNYGFDGTNFVNIEDAFNRKGKLIPGVFPGYMSVSKETVMMNDLKIFQTLSAYDASNVQLNFTITLVEGVPGCGKTSYILDNHDSEKNTNHVVLTATREAAENLRTRVQEQFEVDAEEKYLRTKYRTCDSFLMHYNPRDYDVDTLWFDEGLMRHFGDVLWCAVISGAKNVKIFGDRAQIPFINRVAGINLRYENVEKFMGSIEKKFLAVTHRCPLDVACFLNSQSYYKEKVKSTNPRRNTINFLKISTISDLKTFDMTDCKILTFTQQEKAEILRMQTVNGPIGDDTVYTVHEFQGNQSKQILLVRLNPKPIDIYKQGPHLLVALTRHTVKFTYATVVPDDAMANYTKIKYSNSDYDAVAVGKGGGKILGTSLGTQFPAATVSFAPEITIDPLKQNKVLRDFVHNHDGKNVCPLRPVVTPQSYYVPELPFIYPFYVSDPINTIQKYYDYLMPSNGLAYTENDDVIYERDDYYAYKENLWLGRTANFCSEPAECLTSQLRTSCPRPVRNTQKQVLKAFYDRNGCVPQLSGERDDVQLVEQLMHAFTSTYLREDDQIPRFSEHPIDMAVESIEDWLVTQPPFVLTEISNEQDYNIWKKELDKYSFILKRLPKPKLEVEADKKYPSPQTIAHHSKAVNAVFCPIVKEMKRRVLSVLRNEKILACDMAVKDFEDLLSLRFGGEKPQVYRYVTEVDISKYDKSQDRIALLFEVELMRYFGFPESLLATWIYMHVYTRLYSPSLKFKANVLYQRKSGDAMTFLGNTLFLMAVLAKTLPLNDSLCLFAGDDSLIFSREKIDRTYATGELSLAFNLESKMLAFSTPYFCSRFLLFLPIGRWAVIPDVVKLITKLGRNDLVDEQHVEEYRISTLDNAKNLGNSYLYESISEALCDRYKKPSGNFGYLFSAIITLLEDRDKFLSLYYNKHPELRRMYAIRPSIDM